MQGAVERVLKRLKADLDRLPKRPKRKRRDHATNPVRTEF